jgi:hypothetical protein
MKDKIWIIVKFSDMEPLAVTRDKELAELIVRLCNEVKGDSLLYLREVEELI